ncbi:MAG: energy transducer TonB [Sterolibacterium sp.]|nr:energy transducer TonB [Sterolibacterium sp.]
MPQKRWIPVSHWSESRLPPQPVREATEPAGEGPDANGLRQYRLSLAATARRFKLYPRQALENGWSGTAEVSLSVAANGLSQPVQLLRSSGYELLDAAALEMVGNAAQMTAVPVSLRGQSFSVPLPVVFDRHDE